MKKLFSLLLVAVILLSCCSCDSQNPTVPQVERWSLVSQEYRQLADGVSYLEICYSDAQGLPYRVYVLSVDPDKATLYTGTTQNNFDLIPTEQQDVMEHMQASVRDGLNVIAAVNGDFFNNSSTYMPTGLCIKDGVLIGDNNSYRPFCAMTTDGQYLISNGKTDKVDLGTLQMAVGGSHVIVRGGRIHNIGDADDFSTIPHPRTLSGVKEDGTILLVVIDGRQPEHSNGAPLAVCAKLMLALGAVEAINHDGGGSSTMVLRSGDQYETVNSPSDGNLRKVYNSIQIIQIQ